MPLKVANSAGSMFFSAIVNAIYYAADHGANVISMSLGAAISSDAATDAAILYAYNAGVVIMLAATGNENKVDHQLPGHQRQRASASARLRRAATASAVEQLASEVNPGVSTDPHGYTCDGERWWGSNYGTTTANAAGAVDIIAPTILPTTDIWGVPAATAAATTSRSSTAPVVRHAVRGGCLRADQVRRTRPTASADQEPAHQHGPGHRERRVGSRLGPLQRLRHGRHRGGGGRRRRPGGRRSANFSRYADVGMAPLTVNFTDLSTGNSPTSGAGTSATAAPRRRRTRATSTPRPAPTRSP